jgi:hypothetical protein
MTGEWLCDSCGAPARIVVDDETLGETGSFDVVCDECGWEQWIPAESTARTRIAKVRQIVRDKQCARVEGYLMDLTTASLLVTVYEALSKANREKFGKPPLPKLVDLAWRSVR